MNEPKKRGRPTRAEAAAKAALAESMRMDPPPQVPVMNGDAGREPEDVIEERLADAPTQGATYVADSFAFVETPAPNLEALDRAQSLALRIWSGQSPDLKREVRRARIIVALQEQNLPVDGVKLPGDEDYSEAPAAAPQAADMSPAQALAMRIWNGQSLVVHRSERIARIERALKEQGMSIEGIRYPAGVERYEPEDDEPVTWKMRLPKPEGIV